MRIRQSIQLRQFIAVLFALLTLAGGVMVSAQDGGSEFQVQFRLPDRMPRDRTLNAAVWLKPTGRPIESAMWPPGRFALLQKKRTFTPHLLVIPVGSTSPESGSTSAFMRLALPETLCFHAKESPTSFATSIRR